MTLSEQLYELRFNILRDRSDIIAGDTDSLWSDETLLAYIKDAERRFARKTLLLRDSTTPEIVRVVLKTGVITYPLHESVLSVISARAAGYDYDLRRSGHALVEATVPDEFLSFDPASPYLISPGATLAFYTDETLVYNRRSAVTLSVYPAPSATENGTTINMRVIRVPKSQYTAAELENESELPEDYQLDVLEWAAYRAQRSFDGDAGAPTTSKDHKAAFDEAVEQAKKEMKQKIFAPTGFRFGSNGFSWPR